MPLKPASEKALEIYPENCLDTATGERWVTMNNALVRASHGLTLAEKRVVMVAVSKLDSRKVLPIGEVPKTKIFASEYAEIAGCTLDTAYEALQLAAKNLYNRSITFFLPSTKRGNKKIGSAGTINRMRWVGRATYHEKEAWVEVAWWPEILPFLTGLKKQFTSYQLQQASALRSVYSWRLLELLMKFKSTGTAEYTIEDFCTSMEATEKQKQNFNNIRRRIIEPAVKELQEKDGWLIQWLPIKAGRRVSKLRFTFMNNPQNRLF